MQPLNDEQVVVPGHVTLNKLGGGGTSEVYRARDSHNGTTVAVKIFTRTPDDLDELTRRLLVWGKLEHFSLVKALST